MIKMMGASLAVMAMMMGGTVAIAQPAADAPAVPATAAAGPGVHVLTRAELDKLLREPTKVLLIDVRRPDEVSALGGFPVYLSIQLGDLKRDIAWIPHNRTLVTVSNQAHRASTAAKILISAGFKVAGAAGVETYEKEGGAITKVAIPARKGNANTAAAQPAQ